MLSHSVRLSSSGLCLALLAAAACSEEPARLISADGDPSAIDQEPDASLDPGETSGAVDGGVHETPESPDRDSPDSPDAPDSGADPIPPVAETWDPPTLRHPVSLPDAELAQQALTLLGSSAVGAQGSCRNCHSLGRPTLTRWSKLTQEFASDCLADSALPDQSAVDAMRACFGAHAGSDGTLLPPDFGVYSAAAGLPWFSFVFEHPGGGAADGHARAAEFATRVGMPRAGLPWSQPEFDIVAEWFARRLPHLFELVPEDSGQECTPGLDPLLETYLHTLALTGWRAKNAEIPLLMYGCAAGQTGSACLSGLPRASSTAYGAGWESAPATQIRILRDNSETPSNYWSRSSADGRFVASGLRNVDNDGFGGQIFDLQLGRNIPGDFAYDATFFPDNSGFLVQEAVEEEEVSPGAPSNGTVPSGAAALICEQSVLTSADEVTSHEPECTLADDKFGLYQQPARALDGGDYWVVHGSYESDSGGFEPTLEDPSAAFEADSSLTLTPMLNQGGGFEVGSAVRLLTPRQGDPMLSPSGGLVVLRAKGKEVHTTEGGFDVVKAEQSGFALYRVTTGAPAPGGSAPTASLQDLGRVCLSGGKAMFSLDERWLVFHHYVGAADAVALGFTGPNDPGFAPYATHGASNLYLVDLLTGAVQRITGVAPGQYALFPHFRSDGWIYFVVRTLGGEEYFAASDAALVSEASP